MENNSGEEARRIAELINNCAIETINESLVTCKSNTVSATPVKTGTLRRSWTCTNATVKEGEFYGEIGSSVPYAKYVEDGHKTKNGGVVLGRHMLKNAIDIENESITDKFRKKVDEKING